MRRFRRFCILFPVNGITSKYYEVVFRVHVDTGSMTAQARDSRKRVGERVGYAELFNQAKVHHGGIAQGIIW